MYYQLEYDKCLNARGTFYYKEKKELLSGVSLLLRFDPVFHSSSNKGIEQNIEIDGEMKSLCGLVRVGYDNQKKVFSFIENEFIKGNYQIVGYGKAVVEKVESELTKELNSLIGFKAPMSKEIMIESEEFYSIIEKYGDLFENDNWLQNCAYSWHEVSKVSKGKATNYLFDELNGLDVGASIKRMWEIQKRRKKNE